jgi:hypothetical protein
MVRYYPQLVVFTLSISMVSSLIFILPTIYICWCFGEMYFLHLQDERVSQRCLLGLLFAPENGSNTFICNVSGLIPDYMASHPWGDHKEHCVVPQCIKFTGVKRPIHAEVSRKAERPAGNLEGNSRVRNAPMRAPYTQRFARGSGQNWHFVSLACQENFKQWREGDGPRVEAKPGGCINHIHKGLPCGLGNLRVYLP